MTLKELIADRLGVNILMIEDCIPNGSIYRYYGKQFITHSDLSTYEWTGGDNYERNDSSIHVEKLLKGCQLDEVPPVGTVCEFLNLSNNWVKCEILALGKVRVFIRHIDSGIERTAEIGSITFRPIRTPIDVIRELLASCTMENAPEVIYNAIVSGAIKHEVN